LLGNAAFQLIVLAMFQAHQRRVDTCRGLALGTQRDGWGIPVPDGDR